MRGIYFLIAAMSLTPVADGIAKEMAGSAAPFVIAFSRYFSAGVIALLVAVVMGRRIELPRNHWPAHVFQTVLIMGAMVCLITGIGMVPLSNAVGGFLIALVVVSVLSVVVLKEATPFVRLLGAVLSFAGALIILRPDGTVEQGTLIALAGGVLLGIYLTITRMTSAMPGGAISACRSMSLGFAGIVALRGLAGSVYKAGP